MNREPGPFHIKYRPKDLNEFFGNPETVSSIANFIGQVDCPHAFLLVGPSGTGKTTIARIIKDMLGCVDRDFKELNVANTRGIDTVRQIYEESGYAPSRGSKSRVFLLDESHGLTSQAQEALLKIVEESPKHVYFIFSTTNPEKLLPTLRKRCATYKLNLLNRREIVKLLIWILTQEGFAQSEIDMYGEVLNEIAKVTAGSPRDAVLLLNQAITLSKEEALVMIKNHIVSAEGQVNKLCQQLLGVDDWSSITTTLQALDGDAEQMRRGVLGYLSKVLISKKDDKAATIMRFFITPVYDSGIPGFILAAYLAKKATQQ